MLRFLASWTFHWFDVLQFAFGSNFCSDISVFRHFRCLKSKEVLFHYIIQLFHSFCHRLYVATLSAGKEISRSRTF